MARVLRVLRDSDPGPWRSISTRLGGLGRLGQSAKELRDQKIEGPQH